MGNFFFLIRRQNARRFRTRCLKSGVVLFESRIFPLFCSPFPFGRYRVKTRFGSRLQFYRAACRLPRMFSCLPIIMVPIRGAPHRPFWSARFLPAPPCQSFYIGCFMGKANLPNKSPRRHAAAMQPVCDISSCRSGSCLPAFYPTQSYDRVRR